MQKQKLVFVIMLLTSASLVFLTLGTSRLPYVGSLGLSTHRLHFGSPGIGSVGWLLPANTTVSTSHTANQSLTGFMEATLNIFPCQIRPGTLLYLGLYANDRLLATENYNLSGTYQTPATILGTIGTGVANFSNSMLGFTVSEFPLAATLQSGTVVTVVTWVSNPVWVQVDSSSATHSYETQEVTTYSPDLTITGNSGNIAPQTLSVGLESSA